MNRLRVPLLFSIAGSTALFAASGRADAPKARLTSSFLQAHANDKIEWQPWSEEAFAKAAANHQPIYLHIGAFTSELSRAMQVQSFTNAKVYGALNKDYVCILIDRDVQPDVAALFQAYLRSEKQMSGWPANVWVTSDLKPFEGATYLPPSEEWGKEGILNVIEKITPSWKNSHDSLVSRANEAASNTKAAELTDKGPDFDAAKIKEALATARSGWLERHKPGTAPLDDSTGHLDPEFLRFLLLTPDEARNGALDVLSALNSSALHDPLDGGFFHRSMTAAADFPSFQKILSDQARLALAYLDAAKVSDNPAYALGARSALDYVLSNLIRPDGGAIHAEDATPEDRLTSLGWTKAQIDQALGVADAATFETVYHIKAEGNVSAENDPSGKWKGRNLLVGAFSAEAIKNEKTLAADRAKLRAVRAQRPAPLHDELIWTGENALLLAALARAGTQLHEPRYSDAAKKLAAFLIHNGQSDQRWLHTIGNPVRATAEDLTDLAIGFGEFRANDAKASDIAHQALKTGEAELFDANAGRFYAQYANEPHMWLRPHTLDPLPGETTPPETEALLAKIALGDATKDSILLNTLMNALNDPNGTPRGDVLLAAALLTQ
jgi:hypothetical protein